MEVVYLSPEELVPYEHNAKMHPDSQVKQIAASIKQFGFRQPIVVDGNNVVVIGHGRLLAAKELGLKEVPVVRADDLTDAQIKALRLADNKTNESAWDFTELEAELDDLKLDFDMAEFGFENFDNDGYVEDFFDRGNEAKDKPEVFGVKVICGTQDQVDELIEMLKDAGYSPEEL